MIIMGSVDIMMKDEFFSVKKIVFIDVVVEFIVCILHHFSGCCCYCVSDHATTEQHTHEACQMASLTCTYHDGVCLSGYVTHLLLVPYSFTIQINAKSRKSRLQSWYSFSVLL